MKHIRMVFLVATFFMATNVWSQKRERVVSLAITNNHAAFPFSTFAPLFVKEFNPGMEAGYGFNWKTGAKSDWFQAFRVGYFYHRFVQHALPAYTQFGYRYKPVQALAFTAALGAGYLHSIPATAVYDLNNDGEYANAKGLGRGQVLLNVSAGVHYKLNPASRKPVTAFLEYRQQLQTPFINSYVPLLPYNSIALGCSLSLNPKN